MSDNDKDSPAKVFFSGITRLFVDRLNEFSYQSHSERTALFEQLGNTLERRAAEREGRAYTPPPAYQVEASTVQHLPDGSEVHDTPLAFLKFAAGSTVGGVLIEWDFKNPGINRVEIYRSDTVITPDNPGILIAKKNQKNGREIDHDAPPDKTTHYLIFLIQEPHVRDAIRFSAMLTSTIQAQKPEAPPPQESERDARSRRREMRERLNQEEDEEVSKIQNHPTYTSDQKRERILDIRAEYEDERRKLQKKFAE